VCLVLFYLLAAMNPLKPVGLRITEMCVRRESTECISTRRVTDADVSKKQSTHSVEYRAERGQAMTEKDGRVEYGYGASRPALLY
jgi:hypothetical protein